MFSPSFLTYHKWHWVQHLQSSWMQLRNFRRNFFNTAPMHYFFSPTLWKLSDCIRNSCKIRLHLEFAFFTDGTSSAHNIKYSKFGAMRKRGSKYYENRRYLRVDIALCARRWLLKVNNGTRYLHLSDLFGGYQSGLMKSKLSIRLCRFCYWWMEIWSVVI